MDIPPDVTDAANGASDAQPLPVAATPSTFSTPSNGAASASANASSMPNFPALSASTTELLARARASANGTPGFEEARAQLMKNMMMSDKLPIPNAAAAPKRGRGGRKSRGGASADARSPSEGTPTGSGSVAATPTSERGRGKGGRGRGRGRGGGRGGKRKRSESVDSEDLHLSDSTTDADRARKSSLSSTGSATHTPLPRITKSGRSVNKPTQYVPTIPEPTSQPNKKKRPYRRNIDAAVCKMCHRPTSPTNNQIVFCDGCGGSWHQYCHDPPIENEVVEVAEKEWFCRECVKQRSSPEKGDEEGLVSGESLTMEEKRTRLESLPPSKLITLLLRASSLQPTLPLFPTTSSLAQPDPAATAGATTYDLTTDTNGGGGVIDEPYDGYDTDPPAHYPKPGNGLARTLRPEAEDLEWLVDENEDVFSHQVRPLGLNGDGGGGDVGMGGT